MKRAWMRGLAQAHRIGRADAEGGRERCLMRLLRGESLGIIIIDLVRRAGAGRAKLYEREGPSKEGRLRA